MGSVKGFRTRDKSNEGVKIPLVNPGTGEVEWIKIRGIDSDIFREANLVSLRKALDISALKSEEERKAAAEKERLELMATLVIDWSFDEPCVHDEIVKVLKNSPIIADAINHKAANRSLFLEKKSKILKPTQKRNSSLLKSQKAKKSVGVKPSVKSKRPRGKSTKI
jgi:hypothetical protein